MICRLQNILIAVLALTLPAYAADPLVIHEWGTFTSLQDEQGRALGRINTDDEPVPAFVHQIAGGELFPATAAFTSDGKGVPAGDPAVTVRLETPVVYFHLPKGQTGPMSVGVEVAFRGGWLTQYFPDAQAKIEGAGPGTLLASLDAKTVGRLTWQHITLNSDRGSLPATQDRVWTAPRDVEASAVTVGNEREQFLFYRGVGHLDAPVRVVRKEKDLEIQAVGDGVAIPESWLVDVLADGSLAFRSLGKLEARGSVLAAAEFKAGDFQKENLAALKTALQKSLVGAGLFEDEANALLNTWERSYFRNPGQRVFFLVPQSWTDEVLPLKVTAPLPTETKRVMLGRIELVTPGQRALLQRLASVGPVDGAAVRQVATAMTRLRKDAGKTATYNALAAGHGDLAELSVAVPQVYADFLALGRFRTALLLEGREPGLLRLAELFAP